MRLRQRALRGREGEGRGAVRVLVGSELDDAGGIEPEFARDGFDGFARLVNRLRENAGIGQLGESHAANGCATAHWFKSKSTES